MTTINLEDTFRTFDDLLGKAAERSAMAFGKIAGEMFLVFNNPETIDPSLFYDMLSLIVAKAFFLNSAAGTARVILGEKLFLKHERHAFDLSGDAWKEMIVYANKLKELKELTNPERN